MRVEVLKAEEIYAVIRCKSKEELDDLLSALEKQKEKELYVYLNGSEHCPNCEHDLTQRDSSDTHCSRCGQRFKEEQRVSRRND